MKLEKFSIAAGIVLILLLAVLIVWQADIVGVSKGGLEKDARKRQNIENGWEVAQAVNEDICAMLFYDTDKADCTYSIYLTREGMSYGYFFGQGGSDAYMTEGVKGWYSPLTAVKSPSMTHRKILSRCTILILESDKCAPTFCP